MAPAPKRRSEAIKIRVPRHNAQKIGAKLDAEVRSQARTQDIRADTYQPNSESAAALNQAIVCPFLRQVFTVPNLSMCRKARQNGTRC